MGMSSVNMNINAYVVESSGISDVFDNNLSNEPLDANLNNMCSVSSVILQDKPSDVMDLEAVTDECIKFDLNKSAVIEDYSKEETISSIIVNDEDFLDLLLFDEDADELTT